jgi:hypothetical protein
VAVRAARGRLQRDRRDDRPLHSSLAEHIWPTFTDVECEADTCLEDDMHCPFAEWARLAWAFFENHPRLPQQSAARD